MASVREGRSQGTALIRVTLQERYHPLRDFIIRLIERKVPCIQQVNFRIRHIASEGAPTSRNE